MAGGIGLAPMLGIGFHSFINGIVYSITLTISVFTGALALFWYQI
jgi:zinc and cadmium transporter